jgi:hypothetical protein
VRWIWKRRATWREADSFRIVPLSAGADAIYYVDGALATRSKVAKWFSTRGGNAVLPMGFGGLSADELDTLMVKWRAKAMVEEAAQRTSCDV